MNSLDPSGSLEPTLSIQGETLLLHHERAVLWPTRRTVIVADTHFGKSAVFRRHGLAVPAGSDEHDRARLTQLIHSTRSERLIILGDFVHAPLDAHSPDARALEDWCAMLPGIEIQVIAGNHDRGLTRRWRPPVSWQDGDMIEPPFRFTHDAGLDAADGPDAGRPDAGRLFTLSGHIHPVARLSGLRKRAGRVPIFWRRRSGLVLPSFGVFTGGYVVAPQEGDAVFAVGPERVVRFR